MAKARNAPTLGNLLFYAVVLGISIYFVFAAVQGDFGLFQRAQINVEADILEQELTDLREEVGMMQNKTRRLSNDFLDLDLLDEQARAVLGVARPDEVIVN